MPPVLSFLYLFGIVSSLITLILLERIVISLKHFFQLSHSLRMLKFQLPLCSMQKIA